VKKLRWLTIGRRGKSSVSKSETLKNIRRQTDQRMKHQNAQKQRADEAA
jgi:hypothetical protein